MALRVQQDGFLARKPLQVDRLFAWISARPRVATGLLLAPGMLWMLLFLIVPLALIVYFSFWTQEGSALTPDLTLDSYQRFLPLQTSTSG